MKKILILIAIILAIIFVFVNLEGVPLVIFLMILFPLLFFYLPLLFKHDEEEELTEEAKKEKDRKNWKNY